MPWTGRRFVRLVQRDDVGAWALTFGVVIALLWSAFASPSYHDVLLATANGHWLNRLQLNSVHDAVVNLVMVPFFYAIGMELAREVHHGTLRERRHAVAPVAGALGGMIATALGSLLAYAITHVAALRTGWGIPMSTDVAFSLGVLALSARSLPRALRTFLLTLAISDDVVGVLILTLSGTRSVALVWYALPIVAIGGLVLDRRAVRRREAVRWAILGIVTMTFLAAHIETALAGVAAGALRWDFSPQRDLVEVRSARWSSLVALPLFGLVASGVTWSHALIHGASLRIITATVVIRVAGKVLGIVGAVALVSAVGFPPSHEIRLRHLIGVGCLCAIGITVPLFFAAQHFKVTSTTYGAFTVGLLAASVVGALLGGSLLRQLDRRVRR